MCKCKRKAKEVCLEHKVCVCDKHISNHSKCILQEVTIFQKDILKQKENTLQAIQIFKKERTQVLFKLKRDSQAQSRTLLEKTFIINELMEKIVDLNLIKKRTYFKNSLDFNYEDIISKIGDKKNDIFTLQAILNKKEIQLLQEKFTEKKKELNEVIKKDLMSNTLIKIFEKITKNYKDTVEHLLGSNFFSPKDFLEVSEKINKIILNNSFKNKSKKNLKRNFTLFNIKIGLLNKKKEERDTVISIMSDSSDIVDLRGGKTEILDSNFIEKPGISNKTRARGRDTLLIYNNMFESSLNPRKAKNINKKNSTQKLESLDELKEDVELDLEDDDSLIDFEDEDFKLESDDEIEAEDFSFNFNNIKMKICVIMDQVLYDMNCVNFFDRNQRGKVNEYLDSFLKVLGTLLLDLKTNFSKM